MIQGILKKTACLCLALVMIIPVSVITFAGAEGELESPEYYINETFEGYETGTKLHIDGGNENLIPWQQSNRAWGYSYPTQIVDTDGDKAAYLKVTDTTNNAYFAWGYAQKYLPVAYGGTAQAGSDLPYDMSKYVRPAYTEHELDFSFNITHAEDEGTVVENAFVTIYSTILAVKVAPDGNHYLYGLTGSASVDDANGMTNAGYVPICRLEPNVKTNIRFIAYRVDSGNRDRRIIKLWIDGKEVTEIVDVMGNLTTATTYKAFPEDGFRLTVHGAMKMDYANSSKAPKMFLAGVHGGGTAEMWLYSVKYAPFNPVKKIDVDAPEYFVGVNKDITVTFTLKPVDPDNIGQYITIIDEDGTPFTDWSGNYDPTTNTYTITPNTYLNYNKDYTVTVSETLPYDLMLDGVTAKTKSFTTGYEKVHAEAVTEELASGEQRIYAKVKNNTLSGGSLKAAVALYQDNAGMFNMIDYKETTHTFALGEEKTIEVGKITVPAEGDCFAKIFITENDEVIAEAITIGTEKEATADEVASGGDPVTLSIATTPDNGRIQVGGKFDGKIHRPLYITVKNPNGEIAYIDRQSSGADGNFALDFNLLALSPAGTYTVNVKAAGEALHSETFTMDFSSVKPVASNPAIDGTAVCGKELSAKYDYFHFAGNADESEITWLADIGAAGAFESVGTGKTFKIPDELLSHKLKLSILAKSEGGGVADSAVECEAVTVTAIPKISNLTLEQDDNRVSAEYDYSHALGYEQEGSEYVWEMSESKNGTFTVFDNDLSFYEIKEEDDGKYIKVTVTPKADVPEGYTIEATGEPLESEPFYLEYTAPKSGGSGGGGGGGGGGGRASGGGSSLVVSPSVPVLSQPEKSGEIDFTDVRGHWAENEIFRLYDEGIVTGKSETTFEPDTKVTRAEFIAILVRSLRFEIVSYSGTFSDVNAGDWYADILETAYQNGILMGSEGMANPNSPITREEMAALAVRGYEALHGTAELSGELLDFDDAEEISDWAVISVGKAKELGLINGVGEGRFAPRANTSRAESCVIIGRILDKTDFEALEAEKAENSETEENTEPAEDESKIDIAGEEAVDEQINMSTDNNPLDQFYNEEYSGGEEEE